MEIIFYMMLFCMGAVFGSFFTLAVYRIPLGLDITHKRSFCPNCNHRLEFIDLIPILSYLSLKGKCRYCGKPVRIRYLILEIMSGLVFLTACFAVHLNFPFFEMRSIALMAAFVMFYITNAIILGIDKENLEIDKRVLLFGIITNFIYMLYLYIFKLNNLYRYGIYLAIMLVLFCFDTWTLKTNKKTYYLTQILIFFVYEITFIDNWKMILGMIIGTILIYICYAFYKRGKSERIVPIGFCMAISAIVSFLAGNIILLYR